MELGEKLDSYLEIINKALKKYIDDEKCDTAGIIYEAMDYSLNAGGKRIRPALTLAFAELFGVSEETVLPYACALEMIHTYSLIHDDLPCMDNDDMRRGRPTSHRVFGEANAVLCGDALLNRAFELILNAAVKDGKNGAAAGARVARLAGTKGMIGGQVIDLSNEGKKVSAEELFLMYRLKTGALLDCPACIAIELARPEIDKESERQAHLYTEGLGVAFQVRDDILDVVGDSKVLGKNVGSDEKDNKVTSVTLLGLDKAKEIAAEMTEQAYNAADFFGEKGRFLRQLAEMLLEREN